MKRLVMVMVLSVGVVSAAAGQSVVQPVLRTAPLFNYEDAPATPAGLYPGPGMPCVDSVSGQTYGRYYNVDIAYDVRLGTSPKAPKGDVAIVSDRGCDRLRFFKIDLDNPDGPLVDITSPNVPRVFPRRHEQPSELQPSGAAEGWVDNPVDDQNTVYGLTVVQGHPAQVFVTERERGLAETFITSARSWWMESGIPTVFTTCRWRWAGSTRSDFWLYRTATRPSHPTQATSTASSSTARRSSSSSISEMR